MPMSSPPENDHLHVGPALAGFTESHHRFVGQMHTALYLPELMESAARARAMAAELLQMYRSGLLIHHQDEERELFPAVQLAAAPGAERTRVDAMVEQLVLEHRAMEARWRSIEPQLVEASQGGLPRMDGALIEDLVQHFFAHVHFEEHEFLPLAQAILVRHGATMKALDLALHKRHAEAAS